MKQVSMSNLEILNTALALKELVAVNEKNSVRFQYLILRNYREVFSKKAEIIEETKKKFLEPIERNRMVIIEKYSLKDAEGKMTIDKDEKGNTYSKIDPDKQADFNKEMSELQLINTNVFVELEKVMKETEELTIYGIPLSEMPKDLEMKYTEALYILIEE